MAGTPRESTGALRRRMLLAPAEVFFTSFENVNKQTLNALPKG
jgi:hypothetical protein